MSELTPYEDENGREGYALNLPFSNEELETFIEKTQQLKQTIMVKGQDYSIENIKGKNKLIYYRTGWEKIAFVFGISTKITDKNRLKEKKKITNQGKDSIIDVTSWYFTVLAYVLDSEGKIRKQDEAVGACSSDEGKVFNHPEHDIMATAHTRAKGRAICGMVGGGLTFEEMTGITIQKQQKQNQNKRRIMVD